MTSRNVSDEASAADEQLKGKIRKVLALLEGAKTEGEAQAASLALQRLLARGGLTVEDVLEGATADEDDVVETDCEIGSSSANWKVDLACVIAKNYRCELYLKTRGRKRTVVFVGLEEDAAVATGCFYATGKAAQRCFRSYCKGFREQHPLVDTSRAAFRNGYYLGFVRGLSNAYREQVSASGELAICLQTPAAVTTRMDAMRSDLGPARRRRSVVYEGSYGAGQADGYGFGRGDRLEN